VRKRPKPESMAERLLELLEERYPDGIATAEAAEILYGDGSLESRIRIRRLARTLRKVGYAVYGHGGIYRLDPDAAFLYVIGKHRMLSMGGTALSNYRLLRETYEAGPTPELRRAVDEGKRELAELLATIANEMVRLGA